MKKEATPSAAAEPKQKKAYHAPRLREYGSLKKMTMTKSVTGTDRGLKFL